MKPARFIVAGLSGLALAVVLVTGVSQTPTAQAQVGPTRLTLAAGSEARFRAHEVFVVQSMPNEAVGTTREVSGVIVLGPDGAILADQSLITVGLSSLQSDTDRRDAYIKRHTLQVDQFPNATFVPTSAEGLPAPLPTSGQLSFLLNGDLTLRDVTRPAVWTVLAELGETEVLGQAATSIILADFGMEKPTVGPILSIEDQIVLELDFRAVREALLE